MVNGVTKLQPSCKKDFSYGHIVTMKRTRGKDETLELTKSTLISMYNASRINPMINFKKFKDEQIDFYINHPEFHWTSEEAKRLFYLHLGQIDASWPNKLS